MRTGRALALVIALGAAGAPEAPAQSARAQGARESLSHLGIAAAGHVSLFEGVGVARTADAGYEFGGAIDLGWLGSPRTRLVLDATFLNSLLRFRDSVSIRHRGPFYDLAIAVGVTRLLPRRANVEPYVSAGVGVEAIGSNTRNLSVDVLYNANRFALHAATGALVTISADGQDGFSVELRGTAVRQLSRGSMRVGYVRFFGPRKWVPPAARPVRAQRPVAGSP